MDLPSGAQTGTWGGWTLHEVGEATSTNLLAKDLPPWHAVRAVVQTGGRGRHGRVWVSGEGGLWMSAVVPLAPAGPPWEAFPLAAGLALAEYLRPRGVPVRLRWPNDVMVGNRKLAGILMEKFHPDRMVVGLGLNIANDPVATDPALAGLALALQDCMDHPPTVAEAFHEVLGALRSVHRRMAEGGLAGLLPEINRLWDGERPVELNLGREKVRGLFLGVDRRGDLLLRDQEGRTQSWNAALVWMLREVSPDTPETSGEAVPI